MYLYMFYASVNASISKRRDCMQQERHEKNKGESNICIRYTFA